MVKDMEEYFDVVDENDSVIGKEKRSVVHEKGLWHRSVTVFLVNEKNEIFLQKRSATKDLYPGLWDISFTEHLKVRESYENAVKRGAREELGVEVTTAKNIGESKWTFKGNGKEDNEFYLLYVVRFKGEIRLDKEEVHDGRWVTRQELLDMLEAKPEEFTPWTADCVRMLESWKDWGTKS